MIEKLTDADVLSGVSSPLLPLLYAGFKYPTTDVDGVYIQTDDAEIQAFISVKNNCAVVCVVNKNYTAEELNSFLSFLHIEEVLSDFDFERSKQTITELYTDGSAPEESTSEYFTWSSEDQVVLVQNNADGSGVIVMMLIPDAVPTE